MVEQSVVGRVAPSFDIVVERGKIREFARATGSTNAEYLDATIPVAPPTFLMTVDHWAGRDSSPLFMLGIDLARLLHGGQEFTFNGSPPAAGTALHCTPRVDKVTTKEGRAGTMTFVEIVTDFVEGDGRLAAQSRTIVIEMPEKAAETGAGSEDGGRA